jgi:hypothetical protein
LAIYDVGVLDNGAAKKLSEQLTDWYFSEEGGLLLSRHVRDFYFALQDLLRAVAAAPEWKAERSHEGPRDVLNRILNRERLSGATETLAYLEGLDGCDGELGKWPDSAASHAKAWRRDVEALAGRWDTLQPMERFAVLQQVASILRTGMVNDVESRLR